MYSERKYSDKIYSERMYFYKMYSEKKYFYKMYFRRKALCRCNLRYIIMLIYFLSVRAHKTTNMLVRSFFSNF